MPVELNAEQRILYARQSGLVKMEVLTQLRASLIGAGAIGSFTALTLTKMGLGKLEVYDGDTVSTHNLPNQFFPMDSVDMNKVHSLGEVVKQFSGVSITERDTNWTGQDLLPIVIVAVDSMEVRRAVWEAFCKQATPQVLIEARMGGNVCAVYTIKKVKGQVPEDARKKYESVLYTDAEADEIPCTQKSIIYNVGMVSSLICRAMKAIVNGEAFPWEVVLDIQNLEFYKQE